MVNPDSTSIDEFFVHGAKIMHADRPEVWSSNDLAEMQLRQWAAEMIANKWEYVETAGFILSRRYDEEFKSWEWELNRKVVSYNDFDENPAEDNYTFDWTDRSSIFPSV